MLYYVGKDVVRWIDQVTEFVTREPDLRASGLEWQSFAHLVVEDPPLPVQEKLRAWGVADYPRDLLPRDRAECRICRCSGSCAVDG